MTVVPTTTPRPERQEDRHDRDEVIPPGDHTSLLQMEEPLAHVLERQVEEEADRRRDRRDDDEHREQRRADQQERVACAQPRVAVDPRHALRVDEDLAHPQADQERAAHPAPALVQELAEVAVRADGDDELRALLVREQERDVLARARRPDGGVRDAESFEARAARRAPVRVGVEHELRGRPPAWALRRERQAPGPTRCPCRRGSGRGRSRRRAVHRHRRPPRRAPDGCRGCRRGARARSSR